MDYKIISRLLAKPYLEIGATLFLCVLLFIPSDEFKEVDVPLADKGAHFLAFGGITFLWFQYIKKRNLTFLILMGFGVFTEIVQSFLPHNFNRSGDIKDLIADFIGIILGLLVTVLFNRFVIKP